MRLDMHIKKDTVFEGDGPFTTAVTFEVRTGNAERVLLFFETPEQIDCAMAALRDARSRLVAPEDTIAGLREIQRQLQEVT